MWYIRNIININFVNAQKDILVYRLTANKWSGVKIL